MSPGHAYERLDYTLILSTADALTFLDLLPHHQNEWRKWNVMMDTAIAQSLAEQLHRDGWQTRGEVQMTELGGPAELGDVDALVWRRTGGIQLIECKRLQLARTITGVAEICRRFRGEAKDSVWQVESA